MRTDLLTSEGFAQLVREQQSLVFRTLTRLTGAGPHVEDLAQEAFLRLYRALPEFRGDAAVSTYLYRVLVNLAQDEWKRRRRERQHIGAAPPDTDEDRGAWIENLAADTTAAHTRTPEQAWTDAALAALLEAELAALPPIERAALVLYHQEELSYQAVAQALSLPINTVRTHLHRGRKRLAARLAPHLTTSSTKHPPETLNTLTGVLT